MLVARMPWSRHIIHRFHHEKGDDQEAQIIEVILWSVPFRRLSIWQSLAGLGSESSVQRLGLVEAAEEAHLARIVESFGVVEVDVDVVSLVETGLGWAPNRVAS